MRYLALLAAVGCYPAMMAAVYSLLPVPGEQQRAAVAALVALGLCGLIDLFMSSVIQCRNDGKTKTGWPL